MTRPDPPIKAPRKSGFYFDHLSDEEKLVYQKVVGVENLDAEITLLERLIIKLREQDPVDIKDINRAQRILADMSAINRRIKEKGDSRLRQGITGLINDIDIPSSIA